MRVWKFATSHRRGSQSNGLCKQRSAGQWCLVSNCCETWNILRRPDRVALTVWCWGRGSAVGEYNVLIINRRLSQCHHPLLGQQHPALCLSARRSELSRSSLYQPHVACFIQLSIPSHSMSRQLRSTSVLATLQTACWQHVSHAMEWGRGRC